MKTNKHNLPDRWVRALGGLESRPPRQPYRYGVNELIDAPIVRQLKMRHHGEWSEDISDFIWMMVGTGVHSALEDSADPNALTEEKLTIFREIDGVVCTIVGVPDYYDEDGHVADYKTSKAYYIVFDPEGKEAHRYQTHYYRVLLEENDWPVRSQSIDVLLRDHDEWKGKTEDDYPKIAIQIIPVPQIGMDKIEEHMVERLRLHVAAETTETPELTGCDFDERWEKPTVYAVKKKGGTRAVRGGKCDTQIEADTMIDRLVTEEKEKKGKASTYEVEVRPGIRTRCERFCVVSHLCPAFQAFKLSEKEVLISDTETEEVTA
jgi:hypothetical protein